MEKSWNFVSMFLCKPWGSTVHRGTMKGMGVDSYGKHSLMHMKPCRYNFQSQVLVDCFSAKNKPDDCLMC